MKINDPGITLIKSFEGLSLKAYKCPAGVWTIGYGTTIYPDGLKVRQCDECTEEQATDYLKSDVEKFENSVSELVNVELNENQFSALVSFTYNLGAGNLKTSTLRRRLNAEDYDVGNEFIKWNKAGGKVMAGLTRRRQAERELFEKEINPDDAKEAIPE
jgi:lysozyme